MITDDVADLVDVLASNLANNGQLSLVERDMAVTKLLQFWADKIDFDDLLDFYISHQEEYLTTLPDSEILEIIIEELL